MCESRGSQLMIRVYEDLNLWITFGIMGLFLGFWDFLGIFFRFFAVSCIGFCDFFLDFGTLLGILIFFFGFWDFFRIFGFFFQIFWFSLYRILQFKKGMNIHGAYKGFATHD